MLEEGWDKISYYELFIMSFTANSNNEEKWWRNKRQDDWLTD